MFWRSQLKLWCSSTLEVMWRTIFSQALSWENDAWEELRRVTFRSIVCWTYVVVSNSLIQCYNLFEQGMAKSSAIETARRMQS